ncbi:MAG TPA: RIP metalloprotease RseP [Vicinamibacterales bacterium]|nr:RIP metalloprotease RseP [Vicinamibacterales bacterium]
MLAFVFVLGVLIFVHELGHFLMARRIGVRVLTFSLGFGPKIVKFRRGDTEYCVSAIPLGGYVKMAGENPEETRTGSPDEFLSKSKWQRFQVLLMGPVMNLVLALVVMAVVLYQGAQVPAFEQMPVVVGSFADDSVAHKAGVEVGDRIVSVNGDPVETWDRFSMVIVTKPNREVTLGIVRDGKPTSVQVTPVAVGKFEAGDIGILPVMHPQVADVTPGEAAEEAGLQAGDVILAAGGETNVTRERLIQLIDSHAGQPLPLNVRRGDRIQEIVVHPRRIGDDVRMGAHLTPWEQRSIEPGPIEAVKLSAAKNWEWTKLIVQTLVGLFTRETSVKQLMGPVAIADLSGTAAAQGWISLFSLMAMISLNLGLLNLMPIPVLDGGHILILGLEGLSRRDFSMKVKEKMLMAGFLVLLVLMVTVIYNDLMRIEWIDRLVPWR